MSADLFDNILGLIQQATGNNNNSWGTTFNTSFAALASRAIAGANFHTDTGGTLDLSGTVPPAGPRLDMDHIQVFNGALVSDLTVIVPNVAKTWWFVNLTTGAFNLFVKTPGSTVVPGLQQLPQGLGVRVACLGANFLLRDDDANIGAFRISGKTAAGAGELACDGSSKLRTAYPNLFAKIGTTWGSVDGTHFTLPLLTDTGRYLRSSSGSLTVGTYQANQNLSHTHTISGAPGVGSLGTDSQGNHSHTINVSDPSHTHGVSGTLASAAAVSGNNNGGGGGSFGVIQGAMNINNAFTGITASSVATGAHTHNITGAPTVGSLANGSSGGTEARPESAVALICIVY